MKTEIKEIISDNEFFSLLEKIYSVHDSKLDEIDYFYEKELTDISINRLDKLKGIIIA